VLNDSLVEEVGVDWPGEANAVARPTADAPGFTRSLPNQSIVGSINSTSALPGNSIGAGQSQSQGLKLGVSILGAWQVNAVIRAMQRNERGRILAAPSVTTINGVRASVFSGSESAYVSGYAVSAGNLSPQVSQVRTGATLDVRPVISGDGRQVTLELDPTLSSVRFAAESVTARQVLNGGTVSDDEGEAISFTYTLQLPTFEERRATTTVTIPDGASLLLGRYDEAIDQQSAVRVPLIGSIPFLGRIFGRRGTYSQHDRVYLLTQARIIDYDEQEANL
jgi:type II secretory pathway component GspD/PulD (secretin)